MALLRTNRLLPAISLLLLCFTSGCDLSGSYLGRINASGGALQERWKRTKYLGQRIAVPDASGGKTGVTVSLPQVFGDSVKFNPLPPAFPAGKGLFGMFEVPTNDGGGPVGLIGTLDSTALTVDQAVGGLALVSAAFAPGVAGQRAEMAPVAGEGGDSPLMTVVSYIGNQKMLKDDPALSGTVVPGRTDIYIATTAKHHVVFVFRASDEAALKTNFADAVQQSMESVRIDPAALEAPAPAADPMPMGS